MTKTDWSKLFKNIDKIPLILPKLEIDGLNVEGWVFEITTFGFWEGSEPYLKAYYVNPENRSQIIFKSAYSEELFDYLKEFNLFKD